MEKNEGDGEAQLLFQLREKLKSIPFHAIPNELNTEVDSSSGILTTTFTSVNDILTDADCNRFLHARNHHLEKAV
jgi:hypothetical protein